MTQELKSLLKTLADKYEVASFCDEDPSQFLHWYKLENVADVEVTSFIAAMLAFGNRKQFIPKIQQILQIVDGWAEGQGKQKSIKDWCLADAPGFPKGEKKFYRFYSYDDMHALFGDLAVILNQAPTLGEYFRKKQEGCKLHLSQTVSEAFPNSAIVPKGKNSANKRIHMFLRWMVRQNSAVDLGIWNWYSSASLLIPLDVHVMQESVNLGLLSEKNTASFRTAQVLTAAMEEVFPGDPARADFALFGLGVDVNL